MFDVRKFGAYISKLRKRADMTQSVLADKLNLTRQAVSRYENGDSFPDISILVIISEIFSVSIDDLINAGEPTRAESLILASDLNQTDIPLEIFKQNITDEIINIAPLLKPSVLDKVASGFGKRGIDMSKLVGLVEFMNDTSFLTMIENAEFDVFDKSVLEKFIPFFSESAKMMIFSKILDGELNYHYLEVLSPYFDYMDSQIEAAVVYGVLDHDALRIMREYRRERQDDDE